MEVIAHKIINEKHKKIHWDFLKETCKSFAVTLIDKEDKKSPRPDKNIIALRHNTGIPLSSINLAEINTILLGGDDSGSDTWMEDYQAVRIETPVNYFLWSGVALGIFLYTHSMKDKALNIKIPRV